MSSVVVLASDLLGNYWEGSHTTGRVRDREHVVEVLDRHDASEHDNAFRRATNQLLDIPNDHVSVGVERDPDERAVKLRVEHPGHERVANGRRLHHNRWPALLQCTVPSGSETTRPRRRIYCERIVTSKRERSPKLRGLTSFAPQKPVNKTLSA
jgi:hypothetical protein